MTEGVETQFKDFQKQSESSKSLQSGWQMDQQDSGKKNAGSFQPIKILKRQPNSDPCLVAAPSRVTPSRQIKTLEEREAAYAEARLRILGPVSQADCETVTNGHASHGRRNAKHPVEPNIKIISNSIRQNANGKT